MRSSTPAQKQLTVARPTGERRIMCRVRINPAKNAPVTVVWTRRITNSPMCGVRLKYGVIMVCGYCRHEATFFCGGKKWILGKKGLRMEFLGLLVFVFFGFVMGSWMRMDVGIWIWYKFCDFFVWPVFYPVLLADVFRHPGGYHLDHCNNWNNN